MKLFYVLSEAVLSKPSDTGYQTLQTMHLNVGGMSADTNTSPMNRA